MEKARFQSKRMEFQDLAKGAVKKKTALLGNTS